MCKAGLIPILNRTVLLYPLTPFFIVFCNVIATSNSNDYYLLMQITTGLSRIKDYNMFIFRLHGLFSQFTDLCSQLHGRLVQKNKSQIAPEPDERILSSTGDDLPPTRQSTQHFPPASTTEEILRDGDENHDYSDSNAYRMRPYPTFISEGQNVDIRDSDQQLPSMWDDGLMWELFNTQPSIEWFDTGLLQ